MDIKTDKAPPGWLGILEESEAQLSAGHVVSGEEVHRDLMESIARLDAKAADRQRKAAGRI